jgi:hypothetical protein
MARAAARCGPSSKLLENGRKLMALDDLLEPDFFFIGRVDCQNYPAGQGGG